MIPVALHLILTLTSFCILDQISICWLFPLPLLSVQKALIQIIVSFHQPMPSICNLAELAKPNGLKSLTIEVHLT